MMLEFLIVPLAVWAVLNLRGGQHAAAQDEAPLEILRRRYASGQISREEFEESRRTLG